MTVTQVYGKIRPAVESAGRRRLSTGRAEAGQGWRLVGRLGGMLIVTCALLALLLHFPGGPAPADLRADLRAGLQGDLLAGLPDRTGDWRWPLSPAPRVVRGYDPPPRPWLSGHRGVDLAARAGQPVYAAGAGRVGYAGRLAGRGVVTVVHGALRTSYLPVRPAVRAGQRVGAGQRLGAVDDARGHCGPVRCLHWGLRRGLVYLDPLSLLGRGTVRLLPVWSAPGTPAWAPSGESSGRGAESGRPPARGPSAAGAHLAATRSATRDGSLERGHSIVLTSATAAGGGAIGGAALAYVLTLAWRRTPVRRRLPPDVVDFTRERHRRHPPA